MCGIVGYNGGKNALDFLLDGLERLEYRGYDSAGIAVFENNAITAYKCEGRISRLRELTANLAEDANTSIGIGHTRWATHGTPNQANAHPHMSKNKLFAIVHNGIIENYAQLKEFLSIRSFTFNSQTDTEVIAHLLEYYYRGDVAEAIIKTSQRLKGSYSLAIMCSHTPQLLYALKKDSPLVIGVTKDNTGIIASDMWALLPYTQDFILPGDDELAIIACDGHRLINFNKEPVSYKVVHADFNQEAIQKTGYEHFMLKEIYEQPRAIADTLNALLPSLDKLNTIKNVSRINIIGCGSAYNAGFMGKHFIEGLSGIPVECEIASEYRYNRRCFDTNVLTIAISQSGETADTIAAIKEAKKCGKVLAIVNVPSSSVARLADEVVYTLAGPEIAVATTKGYTSQVITLLAIAMFLHNQKNTDDIISLSGLMDISKSVESLLKSREAFQQLSSRLCGSNDVFFIGRGIDYAVAIEGALKLKEISYIHAESYAAGELKHGTISLIEKGTLVIAVSTDSQLVDKMINSIHEVRSRGGTVLSVTCFDRVKDISDLCLEIEGDDKSRPLLACVALQLFAYYVALNRNLDIDKPRNLAKSVTVE